jgi:hypothetical protein
MRLKPGKVLISLGIIAGSASRAAQRIQRRLQITASGRKSAHSGHGVLEAQGISALEPCRRKETSGMQEGAARNKSKVIVRAGQLVETGQPRQRALVTKDKDRLGRSTPVNVGELTSTTPYRSVSGYKTALAFFSSQIRPPTTH